MPELSKRHLVAISRDGITLNSQPKAFFISHVAIHLQKGTCYESNILLLERNP